MNNAGTVRRGELSATGRPLCPVCKCSVYSAAGIHPQCAAVRADKLATKRHNERKRRKAAGVQIEEWDDG